MPGENIPEILIIGEAHPKDPRPHLKKIKNETIRKAVGLLLSRVFAARPLIYRGFDEQELARRWEEIIPLVEKMVRHAAKNGRKVIIHMEALPRGYKKGIVEAMATGDKEHMTAAAHALIRLGDGIFENHVVLRGLKDPKLEEKHKSPLLRAMVEMNRLQKEIFEYALIDPATARKKLRELKKLAKELRKIYEKWDEMIRKAAVQGLSEHPEDIHIFIVGERHWKTLEEELLKRFPGKSIKSHALVSAEELEMRYIHNL